MTCTEPCDLEQEYKCRLEYFQEKTNRYIFIVLDKEFIEEGRVAAMAGDVNLVLAFDKEQEY